MTHSRSIRASFQRQKPAAQKFLLCVILCLCGCEPLKLSEDLVLDRSFDPEGPMEQIISPSGAISINAPSDWRTIKSSRYVFNPSSGVRKELAMGSYQRDIFIAIYSSKIGPLDRNNPNITRAPEVTLSEIAEYSASRIPQKLENSYVERGPIQTTINGWPAIQYVIRFSENGIDSVGLFTVLKHYEVVYTLLSGCPSDELETSKEELLAVTRSFRVLQ
ncbi:hypothetical protein [Puniceicoccus vermicola]|uniref:DUF1795 domain-containing protein n=1 Tax=Puniceicoccus vermicola TaxID=388746 RepID=A0A7X1AWA1_9BACT|nr:hypothetical protein [Puniceicoccus vermicola]MBC2601122.1 hypothetical protein [Puniceicoccus vermicola]